MDGKNPECIIITHNEKREAIQSLIKKYQGQVGIGELTPNNEVNRFLNMTLNEQRKMDAIECGEASVVLSQSAVYIQLEINKTQADINWCNKYIDFLIADKIATSGNKYTPFDYKRIIAIRNNDVALELQAIINKAELRIDILKYIPNQIRGVASSFSELQQTKKTQRA